MYIIPPPYQRAYCSKPKRAVYNTPCRASPLLCSWHSVWSCEVLTRQNQSVQLRLYLCICIPTLAQSWAFSKDYGAKIVIISEYCIKKEKNFLKMLWVDVWLAVKLWLLPLCLYKNKNTWGSLFLVQKAKLLKETAYQLRYTCTTAWRHAHNSWCATAQQLMCGLRSYVF